MDWMDDGLDDGDFLPFNFVGFFWLLTVSLFFLTCTSPILYSGASSPGSARDTSDATGDQDVTCD